MGDLSHMWGWIHHVHGSFIKIIMKDTIICMLSRLSYCLTCYKNKKSVSAAHSGRVQMPSDCGFKVLSPSNTKICHVITIITCLMSLNKNVEYIMHDTGYFEGDLNFPIQCHLHPPTPYLHKSCITSAFKRN